MIGFNGMGHLANRRDENISQVIGVGARTIMEWVKSKPIADEDKPSERFVKKHQTLQSESEDHDVEKIIHSNIHRPKGTCGHGGTNQKTQGTRLA